MDFNHASMPSLDLKSKVVLSLRIPLVFLSKNSLKFSLIYKSPLINISNLVLKIYLSFEVLNNLAKALNTKPSAFAVAIIGCGDENSTSFLISNFSTSVSGRSGYAIVPSEYTFLPMKLKLHLPQYL
jgi:hypothetical protein